MCKSSMVGWCRAFLGVVCLFVAIGCLPSDYYLLLSRKVPRVESPQTKEHWILVDSKSDSLMVYKGATLIKTYANVAFGSRGVGKKLRKGDQITPRGRYQIAWSRPYSKFYRFYGLNYPNRNDVEIALKEGRISAALHRRLLRQIDRGGLVEQDSVLGGYIGIHGVGLGDEVIHRNLNWTDGCIALENQQIDELSNWLRLGMMVEIR